MHRFSNVKIIVFWHLRFRTECDTHHADHIVSFHIYEWTATIPWVTNSVDYKPVTGMIGIGPIPFDIANNSSINYKGYTIAFIYELGGVRKTYKVGSLPDFNAF